jgi:pilus assembly protein Flp/PilA
MSRFLRQAKSFWRDQHGGTAIEYGFIAMLISIVAVAAWISIGSLTNAKFSSVLPGFT